MTSQFPFLPDHNELVRLRYEKADKLREEGHNPYASRFEPDALSQEILDRAEELIESEKQVTVLGRIMGIRSFGKAAFFHLRDREGQIQIYIRKADLPEQQFLLFKEYADGGDIVGVCGKVFKTKTGETTVHADSFALLTKSVRQLPEKWHGFKDVELRYRQRYVDLIANPEVGDVFRQRSKIISAMRRLTSVVRASVSIVQMPSCAVSTMRRHVSSRSPRPRAERRRSSTAAPSVRNVIAVIAMKVQSIVIAEAIPCSEKAPSPIAVPHTAIALRKSTPPVAPRRPKRTVSQISIGIGA